MEFDKKAYKKQFIACLRDRTIKKSNQIFKIKLYLQKGENSLQIAHFHKNIKPTRDLPDKMYWNYWAITISYYAILYAAKAAILSKGYEVHNHDAAQVALGHLLVPDTIEKEDLEILNQAYKIFEEEYIKYFEDAKIESKIAIYAAIKTYTERQVEDIYEKARKFIAKISFIVD